VSDTVLVVLIAAGAAAGVAVAGALTLRVVPRPSVRVTLGVATVTTVLAVVTGVVGTSRAMFISGHDASVVLLVCVVAGVVATAFGLLAARRVVRDSRTVRAAAHRLADEGTLVVRRPPRTSELVEVTRELEATSVRLARARDRERALESSRRELVAWVSHDLRTPLAGLRAMAEALEDGVVDDPERYHKQIRLEVDRLAGMVDDLFELSRLHAGALRPGEDAVAAGDLVRETLAGVDALARASGVRLDGQVDPGLTVTGDQRELGRALANLVVNAVRHTGPDGCVRLSAVGRDGLVVLSVADECGGIPDEDLPKVFDVAWRGTEARTPGPGGGAGLGLAIVRGIVEAHRGEVGVANVDGGCRFEVRLPACAPG